MDLGLLILPILENTQIQILPIFFEVFKGVQDGFYPYPRSEASKQVSGFQNSKGLIRQVSGVKRILLYIQRIIHVYACSLTQLRKLPSRFRGF